MSAQDSLVYTVKDSRGNTSNPATVSFAVVSTSAWQNPSNPLDVLGNGGPVVPADALAIIDYLNLHPAIGALPPTLAAGSGYLDVLGTGTVVPADALQIIDYLNLNPTPNAVSPSVTTAVSGTTEAASDASPRPASQSRNGADFSVASSASSDGSSISPAVIATGQTSALPGNFTPPVPTVIETVLTSGAQASVSPQTASANAALSRRSSANAIDSLLSGGSWDWLDD